jgi:hypothetical protein
MPSGQGGDADRRAVSAGLAVAAEAVSKRNAGLRNPRRAEQDDLAAQGRDPVGD